MADSKTCPTEDLTFLSLHPFVRATVHDKLLGTIFGSALGDCIGLYTEFLPATMANSTYPSRKFTLDPPTPFRNDMHRDKFDQAAWTDDTDHALLLILSYLHNGGEILPGDFANRLAVWVREGLRCLDRPPLGIGMTIGTITRDPAFVEKPFDTALKSWVKGGRKNAANGSLMRTHPLGIMCLGFSLEETFQIAADMSRTTHVDPRCVLSCCVSVALIRGILRGEILGERDIDVLMERAFEWVGNREDLHSPDVVSEDGLDAKEFKRHINAQTFEELQLDDSQKMGYVYKCLGSAILCLRLAMRETKPTSTTFERLITDLIMQGGDADTNAAAAGALLGAWLGFSRLPANWSEGIKHREWLMEKTLALSSLVGVSEVVYEPDVKENADTGIYGGKAPMTDEELKKLETNLMVMILEKQKDRREEEEKMEVSKKKGFGKWFPPRRRGLGDD
jgi:ADP-ribosylglycohydrolase